MASAHRSPWPRRIVLWTIALALLAGVLAWQDYSFSEAAAALATAGPLGIAAVTAFHLVPLVLDAVAWRVLMPSDTMLSLGRASLARWIGEGVGALIPSAQVGGELARLRAGTVLGLPSAVSGATVLVDVTLGVVTQIVYSIAGIVALFLLSSESGGLALQIALGLLGFTGLIAIFVVAQLGSPMRRLASLLGPIIGEQAQDRMLHRARTADAVLDSIYARHRGLSVSALWRMGGWLAGAGEFWLALHFLGHPIGILEAVMLESLVQAARSAAFIVPAGLGVQEATLVGLGAAIGIPAEAAIGLSLLKRIRELALGVPSLIAWSIIERRAPAPA